jgi:hypothetical protein
MNLTYRELLESLLLLSEENLDKTVTVLREDEEFQAVAQLEFSPSYDDVLDGEHPYLRLDYVGFQLTELWP